MSGKLYLKLMITTAVLLLLVALGQASAQDEYLAKARAVTGEFGSSLKEELRAALAAGGPEKAIQICSKEAAAIAGKISRRTGWTVRRVSLKVRNPLNRPDEYEYSVLKQFEKATDEKGLERYETVIIQGEKEFRYMKAIKVRPLCLKCHGKPDEIASATKAELKTRYPHDKATGYSVGQIRGAFSVRIPLE
jgi:hypothetical protein